MNRKNQREIYTLVELEDILGISERTIRSYIKLGLIHGAKLCKKWVVSRREVDRFIAELIDTGEITYLDNEDKIRAYVETKKKA